jgi:hypothetical protein|uniref:DUF4408 domain-containing protein n=1 Tax=Fagus sylvatica TaxID=28930 RepID=A0A2N9F0A3_FAGSY
MEQDQKLHTVEKFNKFQFLKRTLHLVFYVSLITLLLCYTLGFHFFPHSYNVYFSTFLFSLFTHALETKYMFLICNGILVAILAKSSVSCSSASSTKTDLGSLENVTHLVAEKLEEQEDGSSYREKEERESEAFIEEDEGTEEEEEESGVVMRAEDEEEVLAANEEFASRDELNKRFEEFIRKTKEEIRIEAQQPQLISV